MKNNDSKFNQKPVPLIDIGGLAGSKAFGRGGTGIVDAAYGR